MEDCAEAERSAAAVVASLPDDPLLEIVSRVPAKSLCRFKCVSKSWRGLIADPLHRKKLPQTLEGFFFLRDGRGDGGGDGEDPGSDRLPLQAGRFVNVLGRSVRPADPCFPFLTELPGIHHIWLLDHCNGLLLFEYIKESDKSLNYVVSNPATKQWVAVPGCHKKSSSSLRVRLISLVFDPAVAPHFHLVQIREGLPPVHMYIYSSVSGVWRTIRCGIWGYLLTMAGSPCAYADGLLYVTLHDAVVHIAAIDVEGNIRSSIPVPLRAGDDEYWMLADYVGHSQGRLHYIYHADPKCYEEAPHKKLRYQLFIWVLEDHETEEWVLKDNVSFLHLFGKESCQVGTDYNVVGIHPDASLVYLVQHWDHKLISYHMDSKLVRHLCTLGQGYHHITPYVPYFCELSVLENKH